MHREGCIINSKPASSSNNNFLLLSNNCGLVSSPNYCSSVSLPNIVFSSNSRDLVSSLNNCGQVLSPQNPVLLHDNDVSSPNSCSLVSLPDYNLDLPEMSGSSNPSSSNGTLADITSNLNSERHEILLGDFVRVNIPKIDRFSIDRSTLPCKILEKTNNRYQLGCKFGVINICYSSGELEALGTTTYAELSKILSNQISIREAARLQSVGM
ncbi:2695_t:CDS:2, partial [Gigaspora margarita]